MAVTKDQAPGDRAFPSNPCSWGPRRPGQPPAVLLSLQTARPETREAMCRYDPKSHTRTNKTIAPCVGKDARPLPSRDNENTETHVGAAVSREHPEPGGRSKLSSCERFHAGRDERPFSGQTPALALNSDVPSPLTPPPSLRDGWPSSGHSPLCL